MTEKLLSRLDDLADVAADVRAKLDAEGAGQLDGLVLARLLVAVDAAARKLARLNDQLQPALFPSAGVNGDGPTGGPAVTAGSRQRK